jgi:hypothetical protein
LEGLTGQAEREASMVRRRSCLVLVAVVAAASPAPARAQSRQSGYSYSAWQETPYASLEWRTRCEGGPSGVDDGPIKWTVQYRNSSKKDSVNFSYLIKPPGANAQPAANTRKTALPKEIITTMVVLQTHRCDDGIEAYITKVRYGADADSVRYAVPRATKP